jgi:hypothetical protein
VLALVNDRVDHAHAVVAAIRIINEQAITNNNNDDAIIINNNDRMITFDDPSNMEIHYYRKNCVAV